MNMQNFITVYIARLCDYVIGLLFNIHQIPRKIVISLYQLEIPFIDTLLILIDTFISISITHIHIP